MSMRNNIIMKNLEASIQCIFKKVDIVGPEDLDINFKVKVMGSHASSLMDAVSRGCLSSNEPTGNFKKDVMKCECCRKLFKEVFSLSFMFANSESTCEKCGPVRRSSRKRSGVVSETVMSESDDAGHKRSSKETNRKYRHKGRVSSDTEKTVSVEKNKSVLHGNKTNEADSGRMVNCLKDLVCALCSESFSEETSFTDHLLKHSGANSCTCAVCGGKFTSKYVLKKHMKRHVPEEKRPYRCEVCSKGFTEAFYYRDHIKSHSEVKPFKCKECSKSYLSSTALRRHIREHAIIHSLPKKDMDTEGLPEKHQLDAESEECVKENITNLDEDFDEEVLDGDDMDEDDSHIIDLNVDDGVTEGRNEENADHLCTDVIDENKSFSCENTVVKTKPPESQDERNERNRHKCDTCGKIFVARLALRTHMKQHKSYDSFKCKMCSKEFASENLLKEHETRHSGDRPFPCETCGKSFFSRQVMEKHSSKHIPRDQWKYECEICKKKFSHTSYLRDHRWSHQTEKPHKCEQCGKRYANRQSLRRHIMSHSTGAHICTECHQRFVFAHRLKEHMYIHNGVLPFCCDVCGKGFKSYQVFKKHSRIHLNVKPFSCENCPKRFYTKHDLDVHMRVHSGERPFQCDVCGRTYTTKNTLQHHVATHSEENNVFQPCKICGKEFKGERALARHARTHQLEKKFVCELCGKRFPTSKGLWSHNQTHKGYKPHSCKHCGKMFRSITHCKNHMKIHTGENMYQCNFCREWFTDINYVQKVHPKFCKSKQVYCNICGRGFIHNQALQSHKGLHTGERPFGCDSCGRAFAREASLSEHMKRHIEAKSHVCRLCNKEFNRAADLKKHENRHAKQMQTRGSDSIQSGWAQEHQENMGPTTLDSASSLVSENILSLAGPDTVIEEVQNVTEVDQFPAEHIVLATIDPSQLDHGQEGQYSVPQDYARVHSSTLTQCHVDSQQITDQQNQKFQHQTSLITDQNVVMLAVVHESLQ